MTPGGRKKREGGPTPSHSDADYAEAAHLMKALGHPLRVKIICGLLRETCTQTRISACLGVPQSSVAQHLDVLRRLGIVVGERAGTEVVLRVADPRVPAVLKAACKKGEGVPELDWEAARSMRGSPRSSQVRRIDRDAG